MSDDIDTTLFGCHVVCIVDVLGQKNKLAQWPALPDDGQVTPELVDAVRQTAGVVLGFKKDFIEFFEQVSQSKIADWLATQPIQEQQLYQRFKECNVKVERFSDTFVFSSLVPNSYKDASVNPLYRILSACCMAMITSLSKGTPVRGGVSIGSGGVLEDKSFYGPALAEAHYLESKIAGYPRVVVSNSVQEFLTEGQVYSTDAQIARIMGDLAAKCRSLICKDVDGCPIVDFLGEGFHSLVAEETHIPVAVRRGYEFVQAEALRFRAEGNKKLAQRYDLLEQYIETRLPLWSIQETEGETDD